MQVHHAHAAPSPKKVYTDERMGQRFRGFMLHGEMDTDDDDNIIVNKQGWDDNHGKREGEVDEVENGTINNGGQDTDDGNDDNNSENYDDNEYDINDSTMTWQQAREREMRTTTTKQQSITEDEMMTNTEDDVECFKGREIGVTSRDLLEWTYQMRNGRLTKLPKIKLGKGSK